MKFECRHHRCAFWFELKCSPNWKWHLCLCPWGGSDPGLGHAKQTLYHWVTSTRRSLDLSVHPSGYSLNFLDLCFSVDISVGDIVHCYRFTYFLSSPFLPAPLNHVLRPFITDPQFLNILFWTSSTGLSHLRVTLNVSSSCLYFLSSEVTGVDHCTQFMGCWGWNPELCAYWVPTEPHPLPHLWLSVVTSWSSELLSTSTSRLLRNVILWMFS